MVDNQTLQEILGLNVPNTSVPGERLFRGDLPDCKNNACPHWFNDGLAWSLIADGYLRSGNILVAAVMTGDEDPNEMLYPVCFAYRHGLELRFKEIILLGNHVKSKTPKTESGHDLLALWRLARPILTNYVGGITNDLLDTIEAQVSELHSVDKSGDEFRYPRTLDRKGAASRVTLPQAKHINLRHLRDVVGSIDTVLIGSISALWDRSELALPVVTDAPDLAEPDTTSRQETHVRSRNPAQEDPEL
ncbi:hypothetical protein OPU71_09070 [Niveibacterium sp. 24ML]|uniref:hypothetical protein n=1 Tax=Niveibacterium sp. 24ML TaxID=2985512 RepID=UPI0022705300|nr:hypothetical protein [Niveibacterium sp. 24ML]MCX9156269.1 hypothetical protein [Niveibacterium sp. 24ML]